MGFFRRSGDADVEALREEMVERQIRARGISDARALQALREVPRHLFIPGERPSDAYADRALPIGRAQTISQPYIVALMTEALELRPGHRVLEIGTGSGYQAAVLAACDTEVFSIERIPELHELAAENLRQAGYGARVRLLLGDGSRGWPEEAPFDRVLLTAGVQDLPGALREQVGAEGILVGPVGSLRVQTIYRYRRPDGGALEEEEIEAARFVPLVSDES